MVVLQVETGKKTLILQGTKTSNTLNDVLTELYLLKKGSAIRYTRKNENIRPFESGGETSLEFFSLKTDCSIFIVSKYLLLMLLNIIVGRYYLCCLQCMRLDAGIKFNLGSSVQDLVFVIILSWMFDIVGPLNFVFGISKNQMLFVCHLHVLTYAPFGVQFLFCEAMLNWIF